MSYIRGRYYTWVGTDDKDNDSIHLSSDVLPINIFDELVVMRYAQLQENKNKLKKIEKMSIKKYRNNFGCDSLCVKYGEMTTLEFMNSVNKVIKGKKIIINKDNKKNK